MLIGEVVPEVLRYLRNNPACPEVSAYDHVVVDEYQDLNKSDQALIDLLSSKNAIVIGDENQSIYRFRYAHPDGIIEYAASHAHTLEADLDECRRCPKSVVRVANELILHNHPTASTPKLIPKADSDEGEVHIVQWPSVEDEARGIAEYVKHLITNTVYYNPGDIIILCGRRLLAYMAA
jgi:superfamily I DNA/RNA helicase